MDQNTAALPNYQDNEAAFALFLCKHTILRAASADDALLDAAAAAAAATDDLCWGEPKRDNSTDQS